MKISLYIILQVLTLLGCWVWFAVLWTVAFFNYSLGDFQWWVLVAAACAGVYGLRPNLERAIDMAWLQTGKVKSSAALEARAAEIRPIKRRIDVLFSVIVLVAVALGVILWVTLIAFGSDIPTGGLT